jgi:hypothetical protein
MAHLAEVLCLNVLLALKVEEGRDFFNLPCRHTNTDSVQDGIELDGIIITNELGTCIFRRVLSLRGFHRRYMA